MRTVPVPESFTREQVVAACKVLELDPFLVRELHLFTGHAVVTVMTADAEGRKQLAGNEVATVTCHVPIRG